MAAALLPLARVLGPAVLSTFAGPAVKKIGKLFGFKNGGKVPRTGVYRLHAGEVVIPKKNVAQMSKKLAHIKKRKPKKS